MEHKLILGGGELYLPFARSRIKALRARGSSYATQRFVFPDAEVRVQIIGKQEYIEIKGSGTCVFGMDSGVVSQASIAPADPDRYLSGVLYETDKVAAYNAPFVLTPPETQWRYNPNETGQMSGTLSAGAGFRGKVPVDGAAARSFFPGGIPDSSDPPVMVADPADPYLYVKKVLAVLCPPSIFTGRCRLWVQSLYGHHLHAQSADGLSGNVYAPPTINLDTTPPSIVVLGKATTGTLGVAVTTSTGVYLDTTTGKHWMFNPGNMSMDIYPLVSSPCGERLRKYLISGTDDDLLSAPDRDRLEAYILSECRPSTARKVTLTFATEVDGYSMGYGWHWNWTGLVADIVVNAVFEQDATHRAMRSTHHRITMTPPTPTSEWQATRSVVEGPNDWTLDRSAWVIAEPNYSSATLIKSTPKVTTVFACDAPFYAFYVGDTLQVCRVTVALETGAAASTVNYNCTGSDLVTVGRNEGWRLVTAAEPDHFVATFSCGDVTTAPITAGSTQTITSFSEVRNKVFYNWTAGYGPSSIFGIRTFDVSDDYGGGATTVNVACTIIDDRQVKQVTYENTVSGGSITKIGQATVVIPFNDAEAAYLQSEVSTETNYTGTVVFHYSHAISFGGPVGAWLIKNIVLLADYVTQEEYSYAAAYQAGGVHTLDSTSYEPIDPVLTTESALQKFIGHGGPRDATFTHLSQFGDNTSEDVAAQFATLSGTDNTLPTIIAPGYVDPVGIASPPFVPALVGWV